MTLYLVTVYPGGKSRSYFDSIWVQRFHAEERERQLHDEVSRAGFPVAPESGDMANRWEVTVTVARCLDGEIAEKRKRKRNREEEIQQS